ncbi:MAG: DHH family phosphoesterase [Lachnospiraceae bacterium]|nr:DHH family phosphoesterase [Lachnospiraceae bacterium]
MIGKKTKIRIKGTLGRYLYWPQYLIGLLLIVTVIAFAMLPSAGIFMLVTTVVYTAIVEVVFVVKKERLEGELVRFANSYSLVQRRVASELDIPVALINMDGRLIWGNDEFMDVVIRERVLGRKISEIMPPITLETMPSIEEDVTLHISFNKRDYRAVLRVVNLDEFSEDSTFEVESMDGAFASNILAIFLYDETEMVALTKENQDEKMVVGLLYIDNYEEAFEGADEVKRSLVTAWVEREINKYMADFDALIKKLEKDKYLFVFKHKYLEKIEEGKFEILETIRNLNIYELSVTISIGVGAGVSSYMKGYEQARTAIDLALGRGGDQAVVKEGDSISYYGGKKEQAEKNTRVKARVKALALKEYMAGKEKIMVMGHSMPDIDSLGSAVGIYRIAKTLGKKAYIVISDTTASIKPMMTRFLESPDHEEDMFVNGAKALEMIDENTLLVVVDVNRPSYTDTPALLEKGAMTVVIDHHRQTGESVENAVLSYIEPYASSACEMIAECLQYIGDLKLKSIEADAMYGGVMIDTNNFLTKTGVRTFEACAYLRRSGADVTRIRKMFRTDFREYQAKGLAVSSAEMFMDSFAFAKLPAEGLDSPTVVASQAANEMMNIDNTRASFVFTDYNGKIYISARSIDELNVQVVMEKLGGGGHMSASGAQLEGVTIDEAMDRVKEVLKEMSDKKEI